MTWAGPLLKGRTIKQDKARKKRKATTHGQKIRALCVARDGYCRAKYAEVGDCSGPSEWAHLPGSTRAQTRGMPPEKRHTTGGTVMLCRQHHRQLDRKVKPWITVAFVDDIDANGTLRWKIASKVPKGWVL